MPRGMLVSTFQGSWRTTRPAEGKADVAGRGVGCRQVPRHHCCAHGGASIKGAVSAALSLMMGPLTYGVSDELGVASNLDSHNLKPDPNGDKPKNALNVCGGGA